MALFIQTPVIKTHLSAHPGREVFLKLEFLQPSGSFKLRGISRFCEDRVAKGAKRLVSSSGGNAGLAVAHVGAMLGVPVSVFVPDTASTRARALIQSAGATLNIVVGHWAQAHAAALAALGPEDAMVHPFDEPLIWEGHATLVDELVGQIRKPQAVVCAVGGGGLLCGVVEGLHRNRWVDVPIVAVETRGAASLAAAMKAGKVVDVSPVATVATSLGAPIVCEQALLWSKQHPIVSVIVEDDEAIKGSLALLRSHRVLTEPACGAAIAALGKNVPLINNVESIAVVVCGGVGTDERQLVDWLVRFPL
jgi:L-serine/L-threonine ammonia-lyase